MMPENQLIQLIHTVLAQARFPAYHPGQAGYVLTPELVLTGTPPRMRITYRGADAVVALPAIAQVLQYHPACFHIGIRIQRDETGRNTVLVTLALPTDVSQQRTTRIP